MESVINMTVETIVLPRPGSEEVTKAPVDFLKGLSLYCSQPLVWISLDKAEILVRFVFVSNQVLVLKLVRLGLVDDVNSRLAAEGTPILETLHINLMAVSDVCEVLVLANLHIEGSVVLYLDLPIHRRRQ